MTTAKDLFITAIEVRPSHPVGQGDLSLALAGAELIDLLAAEVVTLDDDRIVPTRQPVSDDELLGEATAALTPQAPYERVEDWLWRRGRDLAAAYQAALEEAGLLTRQRRGRALFGADHLAPAESSARSGAVSRWAGGEPVLAALAAAVGIPGAQSTESPDLADESVTTVVAAVNDAVMELEAVRQRRTLENAAFANIWRGP